jgi:electron transport complex protein RnfG
MCDQIWYMVLVLGICGAIAGVALAGVKSVTDPVIENYTLEQKVKPSLEAFFGPIGIDNDYIADRVKLELGKDEIGRMQRLTVFKGKQGAEVTAVALQTAAPGYGGDITVLTAFDVKAGTILGVKTLDQKETMGLGARVGDDSEPFIQQWVGKPYSGGVALKSSGGEIDAISGATISSTAFTEAVNQAVTLLGERDAEIMGE